MTRISEKIVALPKRLINKISIKPVSIYDTISLFGSPRSGTTWIMNILGSLKHYKIISEPFNVKWYPGFKTLNFSPRLYLKEDEGGEPLKKYLHRVIKGDIESRLPHFRYRDSIQRVRADKVVLKFIRGNRILPWYCYNMPESKIVFLLTRHPLSTIQSQNKIGFRGYYTEKNKGLPKEIIKKEIEQITEIDHIKRDLLKEIKNYNKHEMLALIYGIDNYIPLKSDAEFNVIAYEEVFRNGIKSIVDVLNNHSINYDWADLSKEIHIPSQTTHKKTEIEKNHQLTKGISSPSMRSQEEKIRKVLQLFEIKFDKKRYSILDNKTRFN